MKAVNKLTYAASGGLKSILSFTIALRDAIAIHANNGQFVVYASVAPNHTWHQLGSTTGITQVAFSNNGTLYGLKGTRTIEQWDSVTSSWQTWRTFSSGWNITQILWDTQTNELIIGGTDSFGGGMWALVVALKPGSTTEYSLHYPNVGNPGYNEAGSWPDTVSLNYDASLGVIIANNVYRAGNYTYSSRYAYYPSSGSWVQFYGPSYSGFPKHRPTTYGDQELMALGGNYATATLSNTDIANGTFTWTGHWDSSMTNSGGWNYAFWDPATTQWYFSNGYALFLSTNSGTTTSSGIPLSTNSNSQSSFKPIGSTAYDSGTGDEIIGFEEGLYGGFHNPLYLTPSNTLTTLPGVPPGDVWPGGVASAPSS